MTLQFWYDGVEQGNTKIRLTSGIQGLPAAAHGGETSMAGVTIEDPSGTLDFTAWQPAWFVETACTGRERIWTGYVGVKEIDRGPYRVGAGRVWDLTLIDQNVVFSFNPITGNDWNRPAESDIARLAALVGSIYLPSSLIEENGKEDFTNNPISFGESDYRHQYPLDVFNSVAGTSGKDFYAYYDHTAGATSLFYDTASTTLSTSTLRISNVNADVDDPFDSGAVTFAPLKDAVLTRSGEDIFSNIDFQYRGGFVVDSLASTITNFIQRGMIYSTDRVGRRETAVSLAASMLAARAAETDEIAFSVRLPKEKVNFIEQGMGLDVKFSHLPGYSADFVEVKLISRNVVQYDDDWYDLHLVASSKPLTAGPGGGGVVVLPHRPGCTADFAQVMESEEYAPGGGVEVTTQYSRSWTPTVGRTTIVYGQRRLGAAGTPGTPTGFTEVAFVGDGGTNPHEVNAAVWVRVNQAGDSPDIDWAPSFGPHLIWVEERQGELDTSVAELVSTDPYNTGSPFPGASITPTAGKRAVVSGYWFAKRNHGSLGAGTGWTLLDASTTDSVITHGIVEQTIESASGSYTPSFTGANPAVFDNHSYGAITLAWSCDSSDTPPLVGQWVYGETPTPPPGGGNTVFFTEFPYADGSLKVFVDQVEQTAAVTESDPATGEFTLAFDPRAWEEVTVNYQGR